MVAAIVDAGPLVAFIDKAEAHHAWAVAQVKRLDTPLLVCEPVLAETSYIVRNLPAAQDMLLELVEDRAQCSWSCCGSAAFTAKVSRHTDVTRRCLHRSEGRDK